MIRFEQVTVRYAPELPDVLHNASFVVPEGELCLVVGATGSGKSTLLGAVNGLVPHFTGGVLTGRVLVDGRDTRDHPPRELADLVGVVGQDPYAGFVTDTVIDELAYTMESLAIPADTMRRRIEDVLDVLSLAPLRNRSLSSLSGGQAQRVAIGAVLSAHPKILVLDEPTSALDPASAEEVLAVLQRLVHDNNLTVLLAEHRLERVVQYADSVIWVPGDGASPVHAGPAEIMSVAPVYPPVVRLGRSQGWSPLPLSVRDARRQAVELRDRLPAQAPPSRPPAQLSRPLAAVTRLDVSYGRRRALDGVDLSLRAGETVALMGRNGAGKSTLFAALSGSIRPDAGQVRLFGTSTESAPHQLRPRALIELIGLVPQQPGDLLYGDDVAEECRIADRDSGAPPGTCAGLLAGIAGDLDRSRHPRDLSEGERLALALAVVLTAGPALIALDEPTRGLDYVAKSRLIVILRGLADAGHGVVLATHDTELAAELADRIVVLADGAVVTDGPVRQVLTQSPVFAPQIAKVLSPLPYLTVSDVTNGLVLAGASARISADPTRTDR